MDITDLQKRIEKQLEAPTPEEIKRARIIKKRRRGNKNAI